MENNADKHLREKLQGLQMPYDPAAWEQMEEMLDKKKKRRGFFWWWTGGIAAAVLLSGGGYMLVQQAKQQVNQPAVTQTAVNNTVTTNAQGNESNTTTTSNYNAQQNQNTVGDNKVIATNPPAATGSSAEHTYENQQSVAEQKPSATTNTGNHQTTNHTAKGKNQNKVVTASNQKHYASKHTGSNRQEEEQPVTTTTNPNAVKEVTQLQQQTESVILPGTGIIESKEVVSAPVVEQTNTAVDSVQQELIATTTPATDTTTKQASNNTTTQKAARKAGFSYQLGIRTDLMATMAPLVMNAEKRFDTLSIADKKGPAKFTVSVGLFNEFNFINRISVYMGVLYTRSTFQVNRPRVSESMNYNDSLYRVYNSYTAQQHQIDIPIGLKAYPYVSNKVRFSVGVGIINHIKLKETFTSYITQTPIANLSAVQDVPFTYTSNNPFEVKNSTADLTTGATNSSQNLEAGYFGTNGYSRYYLSVYASLGAEFIFAKKYSLLVEPLYYFAAQRMGEQNRRKHNVGLSLGFKYNFGAH